MEKEELSSSGDDYVEITNWGIVKLKSADFSKKVKVKAKFIGINSSGTVYLIEISPSNSYEPSLIDKLLTLKKYELYNFYGTVVSDDYLTAQNCNAHYGTGGKIIEIIPLCVFEPDIQINVFGKKIISVNSIGKFFYQNIFDGFKSVLAEQTVIFIFFAVLINFFQSRLLRRF